MARAAVAVGHLPACLAGKQLAGAALGWAGRWAGCWAPGKFFYFFPVFCFSVCVFFFFRVSCVIRVLRNSMFRKFGKLEEFRERVFDSIG